MFIAYGNAVSGGVMLAAGLVHLLGEALSYYPTHPRIPLMACFIGLMMPFALEKGGLVLFLLRHKDPNPNEPSLVAGHGLLDVSGQQATYQTTSGPMSPQTLRQQSPRPPLPLP